MLSLRLFVLPGIYEVYLKDGEQKSSHVSLEIIETDVKLSFKNIGKEIVFQVNSSAPAEYLALFRYTDKPASLFYPITDSDRMMGQITIPARSLPEYYCRVAFKGQYGRKINKPIIIRKLIASSTS